MPVIDRETSALLIVDFQSRLMPAIEEAQRSSPMPGASSCG